MRRLRPYLAIYASVVSLALGGCAEIGNNVGANATAPTVPKDAKNWVYATLAPAKRWTLTYVGTATVAKQVEDTVDLDNVRAGRYEIRKVWEVSKFGIPEYEGTITDCNINGRPLKIGTEQEIFEGIFVFPSSHAFTKLDLLSKYVQYIEGSTQMLYTVPNVVPGIRPETFSVKPNFGVMHVLGKDISVWLLEQSWGGTNSGGEAFSMISRVYVSDEVPGRIVKCESTYRINSRLAQSLEATLVSAVKE